MLVNKRVAVIGYGSWIDANDRRSMRVWQSTLHYGFVGALCLTEASETFHHWQAFASGQSGVCVVFDKAKLLEMFKGHGLLGSNGHFLTGPMEYVSMRDIGNIDASNIHRLPFLKRVGFRDEREFRVVGYLVEGGISAMYVPLDFGAIREVIFSPFMHPTIAKSCNEAIRGIRGNSDFKIFQSRLTDNQTWQKAIADYPKRHGTIYGNWQEPQTLEFDD
ncbi:DUF2971 domain-containing protein [Novosphingobium sp.]|uniref:DUF2971 domain-containing protein n=1 Tax=Novosphingobium sp. TaxID=1874826 RepID=UPI00260659F1|nr:DUF2971 domain-containing protein [Novosphingobium sp.]